MSTIHTSLATTELGTTGLQITRVGFGAWAIGGGSWDWGWGAQDDDESIAAIHQALELGVNWIDTAAAYGFGHSEEVVGRALAGVGDAPVRLHQGRRSPKGRTGRRSRACGATRSAASAKAASRRLGVDAIDLYQIHWPIPAEEIEEGWATLAELQGGGAGPPHRRLQLQRRSSCSQIQAIAPVETLQPPYSLVAREVEQELLPFAEREGIGVIVYSPMGSGLLTGAMTRERIAAAARRRLAQAQRPASRSRSCRGISRWSSG